MNLNRRFSPARSIGAQTPWASNKRLLASLGAGGDFRAAGPLGCTRRFTFTQGALGRYCLFTLTHLRLRLMLKRGNWPCGEAFQLMSKASSDGALINFQKAVWELQGLVE